FSSRRRHTRFSRDWSSDVCSSDLTSAMKENGTDTANAAAPEKQAAEESHETQASGEVDFGTILEQFEQDQTVYHAGELVEGKVRSEERRVGKEWRDRGTPE